MRQTTTTFRHAPAKGRRPRAPWLVTAAPLLGALIAASPPAAAAPSPAVAVPAPTAAAGEVDVAATMATPQPAAAPAEPAPAVTPSAPLEVMVTGAPRAPGSTTMRRAEVRVLPGAFGDPFRAVEAMPGVTPVFSGVPYFYVRGAPPGNVGYFLDGVRVPALFHVLAGPAVIPPALVERIELFPGGYPAEYGRFAGGIVAGETRAPSSEFRADATLRLVDAGALVEAPLPGGHGSVLAGARYSYTAPIISIFAPSYRLDYWDYQGRLTLDLSPHDRLTIFAFGAHDHFARREFGAWLPVFATDFHRVDVRYDARIGERTQVQTALTFGLDRSITAVGGYQAPVVRNTLLGARTRVVHRATDAILVRAGMNTTLDAYTIEGGGLAPAEARLFRDRQDLAVGFFADAVIDAGRGVQITPGARVDLWGSQGASAVSADLRLALRVPVTPRVRLLDAVGLAHQAPGFALPVPGVAVGGLAGGLQKSFQASAGVEADLPLGFTGSATLFYNAFFNLNDPIGVIGPSPRDDGPNGTSIFPWLNYRALGSGVGVELYLRRKLTERLGGFLAYTVSRSSRRAGRESFAAQFDRTHVLNAALSWDIGRGFRVGSRVVFYTGMPLDPFYPQESLAAAGRTRLPPFVRLDARAEKRWTIGGRGFLSVVLEMQNATLSREPDGLSCSSLPRPSCAPSTLGPISIPSLGIEGGV